MVSYSIESIPYYMLLSSALLHYTVSTLMKLPDGKAAHGRKSGASQSGHPLTRPLSQAGNLDQLSVSHTAGACSLETFAWAPQGCGPLG